MKIVRLSIAWTLTTALLLCMGLYYLTRLGPRSTLRLAFEPSPTPAAAPRDVVSANRSSFTCVGDEKHRDAIAGRGCVFRHLCWRQGEFQYFLPTPEPLLYDEHSGPIYEFGPFVALTQFDTEYHAFTPHVQHTTLPTDLPWCSDPHQLAALWKPWSVVDANLGHLLWEEMGSLYYLTRRLGPILNQALPLHIFHLLPVLPTYPLFRKILDAFLPALTYPHESWVAVLTQSDCCWSQVIMGGIERMFYPILSHNDGKEEILFGWRNQILQTLGLPLHTASRRSSGALRHIRVVRKTDSFLGPARRRIANLEAVVGAIETAVASRPEYQVSIVEWTPLTFQEQLALIGNTWILITPCGGISMILPFLPVGATAIIMDYYSPTDLLMFEAGVSASMEAPFWNAWPHFRKLYYQVFSAEEYRFDEPWQASAERPLTFQEEVLLTEDQRSSRNYGNIVVNLTRIVQLLQMALVS